MEIFSGIRHAGFSGRRTGAAPPKAEPTEVANDLRQPFTSYYCTAPISPWRGRCARCSCTGSRLALARGHVNHAVINLERCSTLGIWGSVYLNGADQLCCITQDRALKKEDTADVFSHAAVAPIFRLSVPHAVRERSNDEDRNHGFHLSKLPHSLEGLADPVIRKTMRQMSSYKPATCQDHGHRYAAIDAGIFDAIGVCTHVRETLQKVYEFG
jgi:hypothetical protein